MESAWTKNGEIEIMAEGDVYPRPRTLCPASCLEGFDTAIRASGCTDGVLKYVKAGWHLAVACGIANGIVNLFVMGLSNMMPVSVMFPIILAGGIIITYIISRFFYKEKLTKVQFIGFLTGIASVVFLS